MQPVTASVPASARARTSASAVAACSTSAAASSTSARTEDAPTPRRTSTTTASTSPRSASGSSSAPLTVAGLRQPRHARAAAPRGRRPGSCARCSPPSSTPGGRSARGTQVAEPPAAVEHVDGHHVLLVPAVARDGGCGPPRRRAPRAARARARGRSRPRRPRFVGERRQPADARQQAIDARRRCRGIRTRNDIHPDNLRHGAGASRPPAARVCPYSQ